MIIKTEKTEKDNLLALLNDRLNTNLAEYQVEFGTPEFNKFPDDDDTIDTLEAEEKGSGNWDVKSENEQRAFVGSTFPNANSNLFVNTRTSVNIMEGPIRVNNINYHRTDLAKIFQLKYPTRPEELATAIVDGSITEKDALLTELKKYIPIRDASIIKAFVHDEAGTKVLVVVPKADSLIYYPTPLAIHLVDEPTYTANGYIIRYGGLKPAGLDAAVAS